MNDETDRVLLATSNWRMDIHAVHSIYPSASSQYDAARNLHYILSDIWGNQLGVGISADSAWADAARNVTQCPSDGSERHQGSPTWSLASDEPYWKDKRHAKEPTRPEQP